MKSYNQFYLFAKAFGIFSLATALFISNFLPFLNLDFWFLVLSAYVMGSVPYGYLLTKWAGLGNLQELGSGNIGATNALRTGDKYVALLTLLFDFAKGLVVAIILVGALRSQGTELEGLGFINDFVIYCIAIVSILGHIFPVWLKLKGGKGVATALGVLAICDPYVFFAILMMWFIAYKITKISSLSALVGFVSVGTINFILNHFIRSVEDLAEHRVWNYIFMHQSSLFVLLIMFIILFTHRSNIKRLLNKQESSVGFDETIKKAD